MHRIKIILTLSILLLSVSGVRAQKGGETMNFTLSTSAFREGETIPAQYTCDSSDFSPPLNWDGIPAGTKSYALYMQTTGLVSKASKQDVENKIKGHIIGKAIVMGKYGR